MLFVAGNKTPRESGNQKFEKHGEAASGIRWDRRRRPIKTKRAMSKTLTKNL
jgi:hypothetical protein